jgi:hypothetical protein
MYVCNSIQHIYIYNYTTICVYVLFVIFMLNLVQRRLATLDITILASI